LEQREIASVVRAAIHYDATTCTNMSKYTAQLVVARLLRKHGQIYTQTRIHIGQLFEACNIGRPQRYPKVRPERGESEAKVRQECDQREARVTPEHASVAAGYP
jgi:hypothetical protein